MHTNIGQPGGKVKRGGGKMEEREGGVVEGWSRSKVGSLIVWQPGDPGFL